MTLALVDAAVVRGARQAKACEVLGLDRRTVQRWKRGPVEDQRRGPRRSPANKLTDAERRRVLDTMNLPQHRDLPPSQIVPRLADQGTYLASESSMYRILHENDQAKERGRAKPRTLRRPEPHVATAPNQVWSWDITYLKAPVRGMFFYLYLMLDVWSRKIVGWQVHEEECSERAGQLLEHTCAVEAVSVEQLLVLHADNGGPMKGSTMLATMERLGIVGSFSRPRVSDDNPFSESCFRTMKYRPEYPERPFACVEDARAWVSKFVTWYNHEHRHSAIRFVTPAQRHHGEDSELLSRRHKVYEQARRRHPERWTGACRNWAPVSEVTLNPGRVSVEKEDMAAA